MSKDSEETSKLDKAMALKCFGKLVETVELDPDPKTLDKLMEEYNCVDCVHFKFCGTLAVLLALNWPSSIPKIGS